LARLSISTCSRKLRSGDGQHMRTDHVSLAEEWSNLDRAAVAWDIGASITEMPVR
jgi:hypothetical protein